MEGERMGWGEGLRRGGDGDYKEMRSKLAREHR